MSKERDGSGIPHVSVRDPTADARPNAKDVEVAAGHCRSEERRRSVFARLARGDADDAPRGHAGEGMRAVAKLFKGLVRPRSHSPVRRSNLHADEATLVCDGGEWVQHQRVHPAEHDGCRADAQSYGQSGGD